MHLGTCTRPKPMRCPDDSGKSKCLISFVKVLPFPQECCEDISHGLTSAVVDAEFVLRCACF